MKQKRMFIMPLVSACALFILIFDAKTAINGAQQGVEICIKTLIPSLFPFFIVSGLFCNIYSGIKLPFLNPVTRACRLPDGSQPMLITGLLGGYPVGAKSIAEAYKDGCLRQDDAGRMLGFCSNAGPSFIFGVMGNQFHDPTIPWLLFVIIILSAIITGRLLPGNRHIDPVRINHKTNDFTQIFQTSIRAMVTVCGWVILFRVILTFLDRWFLWMLPTSLQVIISGMLELSNGCVSINRISNEGLRFVISSGILAFGGLCVSLQTYSLTKDLGMGLYFPGKVLQAIISIVLASIVQAVVFDAGNALPLSSMLMIIISSVALIVITKMMNEKITVAICNKRVYNAVNKC